LTLIAVLNAEDDGYVALSSSKCIGIPATS
jgi:hypothetical protein